MTKLRYHLSDRVVIALGILFGIAACGAPSLVASLINWVRT